MISPRVVITTARTLRRVEKRCLSFTPDMTRNLKIKVIAFDLSLILAGSGEGVPTAASSAAAPPTRPKFDTTQTSLAIDNMSMANMDGLDADATVHRHAAPAVDAPHTGKLITYSAQQDGNNGADAKAAPSSMPSRKISKEELAAEAAKSAVEYKNKYADKIKMRIAKQAQAAAAVPGGGNVLNIATRWLLKEGMGDVLDYTHNRTVKIAALGGYDRANVTLTQLKSQLNATQLSFVRTHPLANSADDKEQLKLWCSTHWNLPPNGSDAQLKKEIETQRRALWAQSMQDMESALQVTRSNILFVSGDETALMLARDNGYYTCRFTGEAKRYGQITTDFKAEDNLQIKDAIDGLIGIALRHSVSFIPFR